MSTSLRDVSQLAEILLSVWHLHASGLAGEQYRTVCVCACVCMCVRVRVCVCVLCSVRYLCVKYEADGGRKFKEHRVVKLLQPELL